MASLSHFPACAANASDGVVVFQSPNEHALIPAIAPGQRRHGDAQLGEALQLSQFVSSVFVDPQRGGDETEHTAARWMQRRGASLEPRRMTPRLHRAVEQQRETGVRGHGGSERRREGIQLHVRNGDFGVAGDTQVSLSAA